MSERLGVLSQIQSIQDKAAADAAAAAAKAKAAAAKEEAARKAAAAAAIRAQEKGANDAAYLALRGLPKLGVNVSKLDAAYAASQKAAAKAKDIANQIQEGALTLARQAADLAAARAGTNQTLLDKATALQRKADQALIRYYKGRADATKGLVRQGYLQQLYAAQIDLAGLAKKTANSGFTLAQLYQEAESEYKLYGSNYGPNGTPLSPQGDRAALSGKIISQSHRSVTVHQNFYGERCTSLRRDDSGAERRAGAELMIGDWDAPTPWYFETDSGTLNLNTIEGYQYLLVSSGCDGGVDLRITEDNVPQGNGGIPHRAFTSGYKVRLMLELRAKLDPNWPQAESPPACGRDLTDMLDMLGLHINETLEAPVDGSGLFQRLWWAPTGLPERMLDKVRLLERPVVTQDGANPPRVAFALFSEFPYYLSHADTTTTFADGATHTLANDGTCDYYPVFEVDGPTSAFTITNNTVLDDDGNPLEIVYDDTLPGAVAIPGGHTAEINTFRNTVYLDGNVASRIAGIDIQASDFFTIPPGGASITIVGAAMSAVTASAWR